MDASTNSNKTSLPKVYASAIDWWIAVLLMLGPIVAAIAGVYAWTQGQADSAMILFLVGAATAAVSLALALPCRYTITEDDLAIRCGILLWHVDWENVVSAELTRTLLSGPALSLKRVAIVVRKNPSGSRERLKTIVISPQDREAFLADIQPLIGSREPHPS